jgi:catechol 2,3-dioxygenase-like lactoylglutathione lyase family enzyme
MLRRDTRRINPGPVTFRTNHDVAIHVDDLEKAEVFYGDVLGFRLVSKSDEHLEYDSGALRIYINCAEMPSAFIPSLDVNDIEAAKVYLENAGCTLIPLSNGGFYVRDPFGYLLDLIERPAE